MFSLIALIVSFRREQAAERALRAQAATTATRVDAPVEYKLAA